MTIGIIQVRGRRCGRSQYGSQAIIERLEPRLLLSLIN